MTVVDNNRVYYSMVLNRRMSSKCRNNRVLFGSEKYF